MLVEFLIPCLGEMTGRSKDTVPADESQTLNQLSHSLACDLSPEMSLYVCVP